MPLSRHSVDTYRDTSSHATRQGTLGHSRLSSPSHCGLILTLIYTSKKEEKEEGASGEWTVEHSPRIFACEEKATISTNGLFLNGQNKS